MRRRAFTLTELVIAIAIMSIMAASLTLSTNSAKQTAKREAERIAAQLYRFIETANRTHVSFTVKFTNDEQTDSVAVIWGDISKSGRTSELKISKGFSIKNISYGSSGKDYDNDKFYLHYKLGDKGLDPGMTLQVKGQDNSLYYIIIYGVGSRIRTSESSTRYADENEEND